MSREFWSENEFDEEKHLTAREVWETLGKYFIIHFDDITAGVDIAATEERRRVKDEVGGYKSGAEQMGLPPASKEKMKEWADRDAAAKKILDLVKEYEDARLAEEEARTVSQKDFNHFLIARRDVLTLQQKIVQIFRPYFAERVLEFYDKLQDGTLKQVKTEEAFREYDAGILPVKPALRKEKQVPPDFAKSICSTETLESTNAVLLFLQSKRS